jgi:23S rRNA pseudouridine1911/1915/1917 synthase
MLLSVVYEDDDLIVANKPAGITVNTSDTTKAEITLQDLVEKHLKLRSQRGQTREKSQREKGDAWETPEEAFSSRAGIVHRLDKETSGIILIAKTIDSFKELQKEFKDRVVKKVYLALAHGAFAQKEGEINVPVGRLPFNRTHFGVISGGREAVTQYCVLKNYELRSKNYAEKLTLVELYPQTGRTHQIRVHLKYINHPIFGDELYAGRKTSREDRKHLPRLFLHAARITFIHPKFGSSVSFDAPLPPELEELLESLSRQLA